MHLYVYIWSFIQIHSPYICTNIHITKRKERKINEYILTYTHRHLNTHSMTYTHPYTGTHTKQAKLFWETLEMSFDFFTVSLPTCRFAILFVFGSCTFLWLFTACSIGCHVNQEFSRSGRLGGKRVTSWCLSFNSAVPAVVSLPTDQENMTVAVGLS